MDIFNFGKSRQATLDKQIASLSNVSKKPEIKSRSVNLLGRMSNSEIEKLTPKEAKERLEYLYSIANDRNKLKSLGLDDYSGSWNNHIKMLESRSRAKD